MTRLGVGISSDAGRDSRSTEIVRKNPPVGKDRGEGGIWEGKGYWSGKV